MRFVSGKTATRYYYAGIVFTILFITAFTWLCMQIKIK